ncbi:MAG: hypothetical protein R3B68_01160 [Phycisphaerales bacterium]|nr:hypothetical protein [Phycisphaeraceae bacterium]
MLVLVVSTGLIVIGCDAVLIDNTPFAAAQHRLGVNTVWVRNDPAGYRIPLTPCDTRTIRMFGHAADPEFPNRQVRLLSQYTYRPGDINMDGLENPDDIVDFVSRPYDYNLDGFLDSRDFVAIMDAIFHPVLCE